MSQSRNTVRIDLYLADSLALSRYYRNPPQTDHQRILVDSLCPPSNTKDPPRLYSDSFHSPMEEVIQTPHDRRRCIRNSNPKTCRHHRSPKRRRSSCPT